jgi:integrase
VALITLKRDGRPLYRVRWNYQRDPNTGRQTFQQREFRRKKDAQEFQRRHTASTTLDSERITVGEAYAIWLEQPKQERTRKGYETEQRLRIKPHLAGKRLATLTARDITAWMAQMQADGHSNVSVNKALVALKAMNRWARGQGLSENRSFDDVRKLPQPTPKPPRAYTPQEIDRIANAFDLLRDRTMILTGAYSGMRWSELVALQWTDLDLDRALVVVSRAADLSNATKAPKSGKPRTIALLAPAVDALCEWREHATSDGLVFPSRRGTHLGTSWYKPTGPLGRARAACGIHFEPHQLRDTYVSLLIASGEVSEIALSMVVGHASLQTTKRHYADQYEARTAQVAHSANAILAGMR